jgi:acetyl-CoA synthetase
MTETAHAQAAIEALLEEQRTFPPPEEFRAQAVISDEEVYRRAEEDFEGFWAELAREFIGWFK